MTDDPEEEIVRRNLDSSRENPAIQIVEHLAEIEDTDATDLPTIYECIDGILNNLFSNPPDKKAQMQVEFSYATYRITIDQNGTAEFINTE